jgi:dCMP deaminase
MSDAQKILPIPPHAPQEDSSRISIPAEVDDWDEYFMHIAQAVSIKSKDPKCPVGAVIVSQDNIVMSTGFNGLPRGVHDDIQILLDADEKLKIICHAENNAILNAARVGGRPLQGTTIYVTKFPCLACCNAIIQAGIARICTHDHEYWKDDPFDKEHTRKPRVLHEAHVKVDAPYHPEFRPSEQITVPKKSEPAALPASPKKTMPETNPSTAKKMG